MNTDSHTHQSNTLEGIYHSTEEQRQVVPVGDVPSLAYGRQVVAHDVHGGDVTRHHQEIRYRGYGHQVLEVSDPSTEHYGYQHHGHVLVNLHANPVCVQHLSNEDRIQAYNQLVIVN